MCFKASSSSTSPVGASDLQITLANKKGLLFELGRLCTSVSLTARFTSCVNRNLYTCCDMACSNLWVSYEAQYSCRETHSPLRTDKYHACYANLACQMEHFIHLMYPCRKYGAFLNPQNLDFLSSRLATATENAPELELKDRKLEERGQP